MTAPVVAAPVRPVAWRPAAHTLLLVAAVLLLLIFALIGAGWIKASHPDAWLGFGLTCFAASFLPF